MAWALYRFAALAVLAASGRRQQAASSAPEMRYD
jgi:hypothetical protein